MSSAEELLDLAAPVQADADAVRFAHAAIRGAVITNYIDQFDIFLPVIVLAPAAAAIYGAQHVAAGAALVFVATLLGRPIGSGIFGPLADRVGRVRTAKLSVAGVAATTLMMALVPDGLGGRGLLTLVLLRFLGGVFVGGGYTASVPLAMEWSPRHRRGTVSGLIMSMSPTANATLAAATLGLVNILGGEAYGQWGWRLPFLAGAALTCGLYIYFGRRVSDLPTPPPPAFARPPAGAARAGFRRADVAALARVFVLMTGLWLFTDIAVAVLTAQLGAVAHLTAAGVSATLLVATVISAVAMVAAGRLSTSTGRRRFFLAFGGLAALLAPIVYFGVFHTAGLARIALVALLQIVTVSAYGPIGAHLAELFPRTVRATGYGLAYSVSIALPACYPYYLPALQRLVGVEAAPALLLGLAGVFVALGAAHPKPFRGAPPGRAQQ